jgi:ElaB/YqjD/DUF883 family membrane-anchored ribosome-binding protein
MDRESPELIEREMEDTRESLGEKVSLLEQQVVGKIQSATDAVQDTVQSVRSAVESTVETVTGTVKDTVESVTEGAKEVLDVKKHTREHPWAMVGGAAAVGFLAGLMVFRRQSSAASLPAYTPMPATGGPPAFTSTPVVGSARPGWLNDLLEVAGREVKKIAEQALSTATASLKQTVETGIPKLIDSALPDVGKRCEGEAEGHHGNGAFAARR